MKKFQKWMGVLLVGFAASSLIVACGDDDDASCLVDGDCFDEELCNQDTGLCAIDCTDDAAACQDDETCTPRSGDSAGSICVFEGTTEPECTIDDDCTVAGETCSAAGVCEGETTLECTSNEECDVDTEICNMDTNTCESTASETFFFAQVVDSSTGDACAGTNPGSDLFGISLTKASDGSVAYAKAINAEINDATDQDNLRTDYDAVLDGTAPNLDGVCSEFSNTFSLGCDGNVVVQFVDATGAMVEIEDGDTITPMEFGLQCPTGDAADSWTLNVCASSSSMNDLTGDTGACNGIEQGTGTGESGVTVSL